MKKHTKLTILAGIACAVLNAAAAWYAVVFNDARLVVPMEFSSYAFVPGDLPMLLAMLLAVGYVLYLAVLLIRAILAGRRREKTAQTTRRVNPRWGFLGFAGLLGFLGFWSYPANGDILPFSCFLFFGFFGFFYEARLSNTLMDERYRENRMKARFNANQIVLTIIFIGALLVGQGRLRQDLALTLTAFYILVVLALALGLFLGEYLLYRYDHEELPEESEG